MSSKHPTSLLPLLALALIGAAAIPTAGPRIPDRSATLPARPTASIALGRSTGADRIARGSGGQGRIERIGTIIGNGGIARITPGDGRIERIDRGASVAARVDTIRRGAIDQIAIARDRIARGID